MAFMKKQEWTGTYYVIDTNEGTFFLPSEACGTLDGCEADGTGVIYSRDDAHETPESLEVWESWIAQIQSYVPASVVASISAAHGTLYRLSAPGYMDCTDWTPDADSPEFDDE